MGNGKEDSEFSDKNKELEEFEEEQLKDPQNISLRACQQYSLAGEDKDKDTVSFSSESKSTLQQIQSSNCINDNDRSRFHSNYSNGDGIDIPISKHTLTSRDNHIHEEDHFAKMGNSWYSWLNTEIKKLMEIHFILPCSKEDDSSIGMSQSKIKVAPKLNPVFKE